MSVMTVLGVALSFVVSVPAQVGEIESGTRPAQEDAYCWVAPEDFKTLGGWQIDTQFVDLLGTSYLLATGVLKPVEDARANVELTVAGRYRVWVRTRDWLPAYHPGKYQVVVKKTVLPRILGHAESDEWQWVIAGDVALESGLVQIGLHDLTGGFGRCAAILLTTDMDYTPPHEVEAFKAERARMRNISLIPRDLGRFEVIVVGGGPSGCPAAIAAARLGAKTALIQDRPILGGNASSELGVPPEGAALLHAQARETGIIEEADRLRAHARHHKMSEPFRILAAAEPDLTVFLNTRVTGVEMASPTRMAGVAGVDVRDNTRVRAIARYFIDCTGDGWVGYYAGARYRLGREARWEFNEPDAPEQADRITMSGCLMDGRSLCFWAEDTKQPVDYEAPPWAADLPDLDSIGRRPPWVFTGSWWLEHPGDRDDLYNTEKARDELIRISLGYWDYVKNRWPDRRQAATYALTRVPHLLAKRESRRLVGDYILTENDILNGTRFSDVVSYAGWPLDIHNPAGIYGGPEGPYYCNHRFATIQDLPFRCLYSVNIDNLLFAGRCASVTHLALGTVRVERTLATLGQAAGTAAALCGKHDCDPRAITTDHMTELQQTLLKYDQFVPGIRNEDPADLARTASVTASSTACGIRAGADDLQPGEGYHDLSHHRRAMLVPIMHGKGIASVAVLLRSDRSEPTSVRLHLREAARDDDFSSTRDVAVAEATLPADGEHWVTFELNGQPESDYAWVWIEAVEGVSWRLAERSFVHTRRAYASGAGDGAEAWILRPENYACRLSPPAEVRLDYQPANVINGWSRPLGEATNMWRSNPDADLPQWIDLTFPKPVTLNTVHVAFGTDLNSRQLAKTRDPNSGELVLAAVTDYDIEAFDGTEWQMLVRETGNFQRWRRHRFDEVTTTRLRLTVHKTAAMDSAEIYEIRVYQE